MSSSIPSQEKYDDDRQQETNNDNGDSNSCGGSSSTLVDNIFKEFMEKKGDREHKHRHKHKKKHKRERREEEKDDGKPDERIVRTIIHDPERRLNDDTQEKAKSVESRTGEDAYPDEVDPDDASQPASEERNGHKKHKHKHKKHKHKHKSDKDKDRSEKDHDRSEKDKDSKDGSREKSSERSSREHKHKRKHKHRSRSRERDRHHRDYRPENIPPQYDEDVEVVRHTKGVPISLSSGEDEGGVEIIDSPRIRKRHPDPSLQSFDSSVKPKGLSTVFSGTSGSSWMSLPKDMEQSADVNASSWMRLPKDLDVEEGQGFDSDKDLEEFNATKKKVKVPKVDVKMNAKVLSVKTQPSSHTAALISSIKENMIGDLRKMENQSSEGNTTTSSTMPPKVPQMVPPPDILPSMVPQMVPPPTLMPSIEDAAGVKKPASSLKLGIKISQTSAALIASGEKHETDLKKKRNLEEGEVSDSSSQDDPAASPDHDDNDDQKSSSASEIDINDLSSSGSISDSDHGEGSDKPPASSPRGKKAKSKRKKSKKSKSKRSRSRSRSRSPKRHKRSRSKSRGGGGESHSKVSRGAALAAPKGFDEERGVWRQSRAGGRRRSRSRERDRYNSRRYRHRSRSRSRERHDGDHRRGRHHSRSRSPQRQTEKDLRIKIDKAKLRQIALRNAYSTLQSGGQVNLKPDELLQIKAGGKSVEELTDFCKQIAEKEALRRHGNSSDESDHEVPSDPDDPTFINHPFIKPEPAAIVMNIRNSRQLPILSALEKQSKGSELRLQFPVSSGSQHRTKEKEWVPVEKTTAPKAVTTSTVTTATASTPATGPLAIEAAPPVKPEDRVFPDLPKDINVSSVVSERLSAMRKLQDNPHDVQALGSLYKAQEKMNNWAQSKNLPGQFTGSTGVQMLTQSELSGVHQAWIKKDQLKNATPISGGIGKMMLQRMGWKEGTGLGKEGSGNLEPLALDIKVDRKGLTSTEEGIKRPNIPAGGGGNKNDLSGKHPVSALVELCNRRKWGAPQFEIVHESGPDHKKNFLFKVRVNNMEFQSSVASGNKKQAKAAAASVCLQEFGLIPR